MTSPRAVAPRSSTALDSEGLVQGVWQGSPDQGACTSELGGSPSCASRVSTADAAGVNSLTALATSEAFVDAGRVSCRSAGEFASPENVTSVRASQLNAAALRASRGLAATGDARRSASSDAAARVSQPGSEGDHGHMEGLVHDVLQGSLDQAARASELGAEPGCGFRMSAADMANVDSLAAPLAALSVAQGSMMSPWAVESRLSTVQHSEGLVQSVLEGSLDQAVRVSEIDADPGHGTQMSAAVMAGVDSLAAPPVSPAASEAFVDAGCV